MPRFYLHQPLALGDVINLPAALAHHVSVIRLQTGDHITLFNGEGGQYIATVCAIAGKSVTVEIKTFSPREAELPYAITLAQALPEASKMDWIVEKAAELGAAALQPLTAQRCVVKLSNERALKRLAHWQAIATAASEQCGRNRIMSVGSIHSVDSYVRQQDLHLRIILSPDAEETLAHWARHQPPRCVTLLVGPEGGFNDIEQENSQASGVLALGLGTRILRTETAGLAAIAALNAVWGEM